MTTDVFIDIGGCFMMWHFESFLNQSKRFAICIGMIFYGCFWGCDDQDVKDEMVQMGGSNVGGFEFSGGMRMEEMGGIGGIGGIGGTDLNEPWTWILSHQGESEVSLRINQDPFLLTLSHPYGADLNLTGEMIGFGLRSRFDEQKNYDPYLLHHDFLGMDRRPSDLEWIFIERVIERVEAAPLPEPSALEATHLGETGWALKVALSDGRQTILKLHVSVRAENRGAVRLTLEPPLEAEGFKAITYGFWEAPAREGEEFYGLGESFDQVPRRGTYRAMNFEVLPMTESSHNEAHVPIPLLISTQGVGYFFETHQPAYFDIAYEQEEMIRAEQGRPQPLAFQLLWASHPFEALHTYYDLTGRPLVPPYWSFAPHYWRNVTTGQAEVEHDLATIRALHMPAGVFWIDRPYQRAYNDCTLDPARYDDPLRLRQTYEDLGYKLVLWHAPYTSEASSLCDILSSSLFTNASPCS